VNSCARNWASRNYSCKASLSKKNQLSKKKKLLERKKGGRGTSMCQLHSYMSIVTGVAKEYIRLQTTLIWISQSARKMRNHASRYSIDMLGLQPSSGHTPHYGCVLKDEKENNNVKSLRRFTIPCIVRVLGMPHNLTYSQKI
jgi:hypothetical protein